MRKEDCFFLGHISKKHGYKGTVRVSLDTDRPEAYSDLESVFVERNGQLVPFFIDTCQLVKNGALLIDFEDVDSEPKAQALIGSGLYLPMSFLPALDGTDFYYHEVEGFIVVDENGLSVGPIIKVIDQTAQLMFELDYKGTDILVPAIDEFILQVDRVKKQIHLKLPEGLLDLYDDNTEA
jgi:16S rRNA processing protein RimM